MTEEEAKTKWCPMVRFGDLNRPARFNRGLAKDMNCIGSACAMWRWDYEPNLDLKRGIKATGYCGLAGKP